MPTITSGNITLIDLTDTKKIDVHISSNHPTVQIYNDKKYTPDWEQNNLELVATVYADSIDVTRQSTFQWKEVIGVYPNETENPIGTDSNVLIISNNSLSNTPIIRYKCIVQYNEVKNDEQQFSNEITFTRIEHGVSAPAVQAQYSVDGSENSWETSLDSSTHKYIRFSYDGGFHWTEAIKIAGEKGEDGQSISLKGTAYTTDKLVVGDTVILYSDATIQNDSTLIQGNESGDSYLVDGYLCVYNGINFICTGQIQGPKGEQGNSYYVFIRYADDANGLNMSTSSVGKSYIGFYRSTVNTPPTDQSFTTWNWAKFVGDSAKNISLTANTQVFKVNSKGEVSPLSTVVTAQVSNTSVTSWRYSTNGGQTFSSTAAGVSQNGNEVTIMGASMTSDTLTIEASDGTYKDIFTIYKVSDGEKGADGNPGESAPIAFLTNESITFAANPSGQITGTTVYCNVVAYNGTTKVLPTIGDILNINSLPTGMTIGTPTEDTENKELRIPITITDKATLGSTLSNNGVIKIPVSSPAQTTLKLNWNKINAGATGRGVKSIVEEYYQSTSATTQSGGSWSTTVPTWVDGKYIWTRSVISYTDSTSSTTSPICITGQKGATGGTGASGVGVSSVDVWYYQSSSATSLSGGSWVTTAPTWVDGKYIWTKTITTYTNNTTDETSAVCITGQKGTNGTNASLVDITPSALYFKSTTGKDGTFTPDYIYLYPRFQTVTFGKWEYSVNGTTWVAVSGANGLTISTYNSIANTLRIAKTSTLYTDTVTSVSFRCVSSNASVYDTVSIAKLFDVDVEEINTRITDSLAEVKTTTDSISSRVSVAETSIGTINNNISSITNRVSAAEQKITADAIVSTVTKSTTYTNDLGKKVNSSEIISKINQTAESVTISANKIGLLGATNIPDLTADKIKGGTLTLGGSSATTQSGQLLVKNASDTEMLKLNKDGIVVKSGHLAIAEDFANSRFDWETETWYTTTNTRQLDLGDTYIRMGVYSPSGYTNYMRLLDNGLYFSGNAQGLGSWGSFIGHSSGDFVIQDSVRSNILFRGHDGDEMASISSDGFYINGPVYGGITSGNAKQLNNVFVQHFSTAQTGYIAIRLGTATRSLNSMITIKGHVTSYQNSTSFEASCYFYKSNSVFYNPVATISNPDVLREVYFAEGISDGCVYLIIGSTNSAWNHPTVAIDTLTIGYSGHTAYEWNTGWIATVHTNLSNFQTVTPCHRGGMKKTLWSGAVKNGATITVNENIRNFKFLTCIIGEETSDLGIVLGTFLDDTLPQLHFGAIYTDTNGLAGNDLMGAKFRVNSETSLTLDGCASKFASTLHCKKIVGWR